MRRLEIIALDLEGTLISNAVSQFARPGLRKFLESCRRSVPRVVLFTSVPEVTCRDIARTLVAEGSAPDWFAHIEYIDWDGPYKDLTRIRDPSPDSTVLVDDYEAYVHPNQKRRWIPIRSYAAPYPDEDGELRRVTDVLERDWGCGQLASAPVVIERVSIIDDLEPMRDGRRHPVDVVWGTSALYAEPVLFTSDLHKDCGAALDQLATLIDPGEWTFVALGDMAGTTRWGASGDPTRDYLRIHEAYRKFYFVDGNHDRPEAAAYELRNEDGSPCCLQLAPGRIGEGTIAGVSGIQSGGNAPGRVSREVFAGAVSAALGENAPGTLATHETPKISGFTPAFGNADLTRLIVRDPPRVHAFGHCHLEPAIVRYGHTTFINADRRVILLRPH